MKRTVWVALLTLSSVTAVLGLVPPITARHGSVVTVAPQNDTEAIRAVLSMQQTAWNDGDVDRFLQGYWQSEQLTFSGSSGTFRGYDAVRERYKKSYPDRQAMGKLEFSSLEVRSLGPNAALVLGRWHLNREKGDIGGVFSLVFQRFDKAWLIVHDHTSVVPESSVH